MMLEVTQLEKYLFWVVAAGAILVAMSLIWLIVRAIRTHIAWGIACMFLLPIPLFSIKHWKRARLPLCFLFVGLIMSAGTMTANHLGLLKMDLGERDKMVKGERHITLTGWDKKDYSVLKDRPDVVVLQMANADVDDAVLTHLKGFDKLKELDLNESGVTDAGLAVLAELPALRDLRLRKTAITDEGFRKSLMPKESLSNLDLRETAVKSATAREWKNAKPDRQYLR